MPGEHSSHGGKSIFRFIKKTLITCFMASLILFPIERWAEAHHLGTYAELAERGKEVNASLLGFAKNVSPAGLYSAYKSNLSNYHYGGYFYSLRSPFNITRACTSMQKRVFPREAVNPGLFDKILAPDKPVEGAESDDTALYFTYDRTGAFKYPFDREAFDKEPTYLQNACALKVSPEVVRPEYAQISFSEKLLALPDGLITWLGNNWHYADKSANWPGRIFLLLSVLFSLLVCQGLAASDVKISTVKMVLIFVGLFLLVQLVLGLCTLLLYGLIWLLVAIGNKIGAVFSALISTLGIIGSFITFFVREVAAHLGVEGKGMIAEKLRIGVHGFGRAKIK
jgi:hypothetical protein